MIRLAVVVEGQTEETFIKDILAEVLRCRKIEPIPVLIGRARSSGQGGGNVSVDRLVSEMVNLRYSHDAVTSLVDFYGFRDRVEATVEALEQRLMKEVQAKMRNTKWLFPYVQKHEFEGILFSNVEAFRAIGDRTDGEIRRLLAVREAFSTPEEINDNPGTAPSKRIQGIISGYRKRLHGPIVARRTGLERIRTECPRFRDWLSRLENLSQCG